MAIMIGMLGFSACSLEFETPDTNTANGVTVSMKQPEISFFESKGLVRIPVVVEGNANGYVTATCKVEEYMEGGVDAAIDFAHYMVTSQTINIADGDHSGYFEVKLIDDRDINDPRYFRVTLVEAQGATIGALNSTVVEIEDNDDRPYDRLDGDWYMAYETGSGSPARRQVTLATWDTEHWAYGYSYQLWGVLGENNPYDEDATTDEKIASGAFPILVMFNYNETTEEGSLRIKIGQSIGKIKDSSGALTDVFLYGLTEDGYIQSSGNITLTWNEDASELYFTSGVDGGKITLAPIYVDANRYFAAASVVDNISGFSRDLK